MSRETTPIELTYVVPGVSCSNCGGDSGRVGHVLGVREVGVELAQKRVTVRGERLDDAAVRIEDADYEVER